MRLPEPPGGRELILMALALLILLLWACGPMATLKNMNPDLGDSYHVVKAEIRRLENLCMNDHTWSLANRGKRMTTHDAQKLCDRETGQRWLFYNWVVCHNSHLEDGLLERCGPRPKLPGEGT